MTFLAMIQNKKNNNKVTEFIQKHSKKAEK